MVIRPHWFTLAGFILSIVLSIAFLSSGIPKLINAEVPAIEFAVWGYPGWLLYVVGLLEVTGALAILHPRSARWGFAMLAVVVGGAMVTHVRFAEWRALGQAGAFATLLAAAAWWRRDRSQAGD